MAYANEGTDVRAEVKQGTDADSLVYYAKDNGVPVTVDPGTAFVTIKDTGSADLVARTAATIAAGGKLSRSQTWPEATYPLLEDYQAVWEWQVGGIPFSDVQFFDVVRNKLPIMIDTSDLQEFYPNLDKHLNAIEETDASKAIRTAWNTMLDRIRTSGARPSLIVDRARLVMPAKHLAMANVARMLCRKEGDIWDKRADHHDKQFEILFGGLGSLRYDINENGVVDKEGDRVEKARPSTRRMGV